MRALLIKKEPIEKILEGKKIWEIRGSRTSVRETVALIRSGSGTIVGICDVVNCIGPLTDEQLRKNARKAGIKQNEASVDYYEKTYAWVLKNPQSLKAPVPYEHPSGAVIWVKLDARTERAVCKASLRG